MENEFHFERPVAPLHLQIFFQIHQGCKTFYKTLLTDTHEEPLCQNIWLLTLNKDFQGYDIGSKWPVIYKICHKCVQENHFVWFQYRILFKILGTKDYMKKVQLSNDNHCGLCSLHDETIEHLFSKCIISLELWKNVKDWPTKKLNISLNFNESVMILGY